MRRNLFLYVYPLRGQGKDCIEKCLSDKSARNRAEDKGPNEKGDDEVKWVAKRKKSQKNISNPNNDEI